MSLKDVGTLQDEYVPSTVLSEMDLSNKTVKPKPILFYLTHYILALIG